ncbi:hypothetical protein [Actibacterium sp. D379-3]
MLTELRTVLNRSSATLMQDAAGAIALMVMLVVGLHLPAFV